MSFPSFILGHPFLFRKSHFHPYSLLLTKIISRTDVPGQVSIYLSHSVPLPLLIRLIPSPLLDLRRDITHTCPLSDSFLNNLDVCVTNCLIACFNTNRRDINFLTFGSQKACWIYLVWYIHYFTCQSQHKHFNYPFQTHFMCSYLTNVNSFVAKKFLEFAGRSIKLREFSYRGTI